MGVRRKWNEDIRKELNCSSKKTIRMEDVVVVWSLTDSAGDRHVQQSNIDGEGRDGIPRKNWNSEWKQS